MRLVITRGSPREILSDRLGEVPRLHGRPRVRPEVVRRHDGRHLTAQVHHREDQPARSVPRDELLDDPAQHRGLATALVAEHEQVLVPITELEHGRRHGVLPQS